VGEIDGGSELEVCECSGGGVALVYAGGDEAAGIG
jgi:hypothetical protein